MPKPLYADLDDFTKISKQWKKAKSFFKKEDWSAAMVRAATAAEISANHAIRHEFATRSSFDKDFVDKMLRWANGLEGKLTKLLTPLFAGTPHAQAIKGLKAVTEDINAKRNEIVHSGHFMNKQEAEKHTAAAKQFIETLIRISDQEFTLPDLNS